MKVLVSKAENCVGCRICEQWCSMIHFNVNNPKKSRINVIRDHNDFMDYPLNCHQCADAPCVNACPEKIKALSKDPETGAVKVNEEKCVACKRCVRACPYNAIKVHPEERHVLVCDLCGGDPQCVKHCPQDALLYMEREAAEEFYQAKKGLKVYG